MNNQITRWYRNSMQYIRFACRLREYQYMCMYVMWLKEINTRPSHTKNIINHPLQPIALLSALHEIKSFVEELEKNDVLQKCNFTSPSYNLVFLSLSQFYIKALSVAFVNIDQYCSYPIRIIHSRYHAGNASNVYALEDIVILCLCLTSTIIQQRQDFNDTFCEIDRRNKLNRNNYLDVECDIAIFFNVTIHRF